MIESLFARRIEITGELAVITALHVGSGDHESDEAIPVSEADKRSGLNANAGSSRVQIDARGLPYIPGSSIKGALRALAESVAASKSERSAVATLFGDPKDEASGAMGALIIYGAMLKHAPSNSSKPRYDQKNKNRNTGLALAARTAIDPGRGTADRHKLFHAEEVVPGAIFRLRMQYLSPRAADDERDARSLLARLLATLESETGVALGRGTTDGAGRARLTGHKMVAKQLDPKTGRLVENLDDPGFPKSSAIERPGQRFYLKLVCNGPFFVNDWSYERPKKSKTDPHLVALFEAKAKSARRREGPSQHHGGELTKSTTTPALPGTSFMGALRARAQWLAAIEADAGAHDAQRDDDPRIDFLFGSTDQRARLSLESIKCIDPGRLGTPTSVRIDRFSGAPMEGALFSVECVYDPQFEVVLRLELPRKVEEASHEAARQLLEKLRDDLNNRELKLGHGTNRGFGWFAVNWRAVA